MGASIIESEGAVILARRIHTDEHSGVTLPISGRSFTPRSFATAIKADVGESEAYKAALLRGEIGLQRPMGVNVRGADFITAICAASGEWEVICTDVKTSLRGSFPPEKKYLRGDWLAEARAAKTKPRLRLAARLTDVKGASALLPPDPAKLQQIEEAIIAAPVRPRPRQLNANYSPAGQGVITGW